jgi:hypothetical protein
MTLSQFHQNLFDFGAGFFRLLFQAELKEVKRGGHIPHSDLQIRKLHVVRWRMPHTRRPGQEKLLDAIQAQFRFVVQAERELARAVREPNIQNRR